MLKKRNYYRRVKLYGHLFRHRNSYKKRFRYHKTLKKKLANLSFLLFFIFRATISNALFQSAAIIALINSRNLNMNSNIFFNIIKKNKRRRKKNKLKVIFLVAKIMQTNLRIQAKRAGNRLTLSKVSYKRKKKLFFKQQF